MFRQFFDTSFTDYRQIRIVLQELPDNALARSSSEFQRFSKSIFNHKNYIFENFKIEYCYVKRSLTLTEEPFNEIQLYRRPFGFIFFTVCHTSEELRLVLEEFSTIKQREKNVPAHLFVQYRAKTNFDDDDDDVNPDDDNEIFSDQKSNAGTIDDVSSEYIPSARQSFSSMISTEGYHALPSSSSLLKLQASLSNDDNLSVTSDPASLTNSFNGTQTFHETSMDHSDEVAVVEDASATITINRTQSIDQTIKKFRPPLLKSKTIASATTHLFDSFDSDLTRSLNRLETNLSKSVLEPKVFNPIVYSIDPQLADILLMLNSEKDCSFLEYQSGRSIKFTNDQTYINALNRFNMYIMQAILSHYSKANAILSNESSKLKLSKKLIEARTIKRKADCCLLIGIIEKANQDYQRAAEALKAQNDSLWLAATLEARVAGSFLSTHKPKRHLQKTISFLQQISLTKRIPVEKFLNRSNTPLNSQPKFELALQMYNTANRSLFNNMEFQLELDLCLRWCSFLQEQSDINTVRGDIIRYIDRINILGSYLEQHIDIIYLNSYLAESFECIGYKRKSALYYRSAAFSGLELLNEQNDYHEEIHLFDKLIKEARKGYGIDENKVIFPLIQKTILNESIQISLKLNDFTTIIENVHFAIESLLGHMTDAELEALLSFLHASDESIECSYCSIPRLKSLDIMPLPIGLKAYKFEDDNNIFIYRAPRTAASQQQSVDRKVEFLWIKNEPAQIKLVVENYLPSPMVIDQLQFITDNELFTNPDTKYNVPSRKTISLLIDCIPKDIGHLHILGLSYHIWSTDQKFRFGDFPNIRQCACSVDIVDELPTLNVESLLVNDAKVERIDNSTTYTAKVHRGDELHITLGLINASSTCTIENLKIEVFAFGSNMTENSNISKLDLPILISKSITAVMDLTGIYNRCLARRDRSTVNLECLTIEFRLNYSNVAENTEGYYRRNVVELRLDYISSVTFEINDIQSDEDDLSYLMCCTIDNHLSEEVIFQNNIIKSSESSLILLKQDKIKLDVFPSELNKLINDIRIQLPTYIHYKTNDSNKQLNLPVNWQKLSDDKIQNHLYDLIQSPYTCYWNFERIMNTLHIRLCVQAKYYQISKLEFIFPSLNGIQFLNSNKILFENMDVGKYLMAERILISSQENNSDVLVVDVSVNNIKLKRFTLTF